MGKAWTSARHLPTPCPHSALSRPHPHRFNNMILVITITGAFGAIASARTGGRAAPCLMRSSPPRPIPHCTVTRARLRSQPAGRWPAPSSTRGETTPQTREREAPPRPVRAGRNRGQVTQESRSSVPGIAVKCAGIRTDPIDTDSCAPPPDPRRLRGMRQPVQPSAEPDARPARGLSSPSHGDGARTPGPARFHSIVRPLALAETIVRAAMDYSFPALLPPGRATWAGPGPSARSPSRFRSREATIDCGSNRGAR